MNNKEEYLENQLQLSKRHFGLLLGLISFLIIRVIALGETEQMLILSNILIIGVLAADCVFTGLRYFNSYEFVKVFRYLEIFAAGIFLADYHIYGIETIIEFLLYVMFCFESFIMIDYTEKDKRHYFTFLVVLPVIISAIFMCITSDDDFTTSLVSNSVMIVLLYSILICLASFLAERENQYQKRVLAKERMIDKAKDDYNSLESMQSKLVSVNEQLGLKKVELESAYKKINDASEQTELLNNILKDTSTMHNYDDLMKYIDRVLMNYCDAEYTGLIFENEKFRKRYECTIGNIITDPEDVKCLCDQFVNMDFISRHSRIGELYVNNNVSYEQFPYLKNYRIKSIVIKTYLSVDGFSFTYVIFGKFIDQFKSKVTYLDNILSQIMVEFNNIVTYIKMEDMAKRDGLSGLLNRRYLNIYMQELCNSREIVNQQITAVLFDIDHFKRVNDTYGHLFGDIVIKAVAEIADYTAAQNGGICARYGGEEFVLCFRNKNYTEVYDIIQKMHENIKTCDISNDDITIRINVSIGISTYPDICKNPVQLIDRADKAMYISKETGRGKITIDAGEE